jgi:hypothetical protein
MLLINFLWLLAAMVILVGLMLIDKCFNDLQNLIGINLMIFSPLTNLRISSKLKLSLGTPANTDLSMT